MQTRWRHLVIFDYEDSIEGARFERELYTYGLLKAPKILLGWSGEFGELRRDGIVDIACGLYDSFISQFHSAVWDIRFCVRLAEQFRIISENLNDVTLQLENKLLEQGNISFSALAKHHSLLTDLMAFHTLNWVLPFENFQQHLTLALGKQLGLECFLLLLTPSNAGHILDYHRELLRDNLSDYLPSSSKDTSRRRASAALSSDSSLQHQTKGPYQVFSVPRAEAPSKTPDETAYELKTLIDSRSRVEIRRDELYSFALLVSRSDSNRFQQTQAISTVSRLAAEEEERRRELQQRSLDSYNKLFNHLGLDPQEATWVNLGRALGMSTHQGASYV